MYKIQIQHLSKSIHRHPILQDIHLTAKKGDVIAVMGSSGSGKSTLLRCLNLLTLPDSGSIQMDQQKVQFGLTHAPIQHRQLIEWRKKIGMVFQQFNLWSHMTVLENLIEAPIHVLKRNKQEVIKEAKHLLEKMGLSAKVNHYPAQLSGGQQQRVAIARALMMKPDIMLFDEPTSALDPEMVSEVLMVMQALAAEGMTMFIATHELNFAKRVANRSLFLENGQIIEQGDTQSMFKHPQTERFRRFLEALQH